MPGCRDSTDSALVLTMPAAQQQQQPLSAAAAPPAAEARLELVPRQLQFGSGALAAAATSPHWQPRRTPELGRSGQAGGAAVAAAAPAAYAPNEVNPWGWAYPAKKARPQPLPGRQQQQPVQQQQQQRGKAAMTPLRGAYAVASPARPAAPAPQALGALGLSPQAGRGLFAQLGQDAHAAASPPGRSPLRYRAVASPGAGGRPAQAGPAAAPQFQGFPRPGAVIHYMERIKGQVRNKERESFALVQAP